MPGEIHEYCAVGGIVIDPDAETVASSLAFDLAFIQQHRGQESSGMATIAPNGRLQEHRDKGLVVDVYDEDALSGLDGDIALIGNRYSTSGGKDGNFLPFTDRATGTALSLNGNIARLGLLKRFVSEHNINTRTANDVELAGNAVTQHVRDGMDVADGMEATYPLLQGAFSAIAMRDNTLVAARDPFGIRPLAIGRLGNGYVVSSETCGINAVGAEYVREVGPGEMVVITAKGIEESRQLAEGQETLDMFEFVYFARHDSQLYGQRVNEVRRRFGEMLALEHPPLTDDLKNIVVVPVPDTSIPAAEGYADALGLRHSQALIKNRYIGRVFMQPTHADRVRMARLKHNVIDESVKGKDVIIIDDSIVRLNTIPHLVGLMGAAGAKSVTTLIASPPVRFPDFYGIDTPSQSELAAANMTIKQMECKISPSDFRVKLGYLPLSRMVEATGLPYSMFNLSCFNGEYPLDIGRRNMKQIKTPVSMKYAE